MLKALNVNLTDVKVEDNHITANVETKVVLDGFEFEDQTIDFISAIAEFKIWINIYDSDVTLDERVEIREIESQLTSLTVEDSSDKNLNPDRLHERAFEFFIRSHKRCRYLRLRDICLISLI